MREVPRDKQFDTAGAEDLLSSTKETTGPSEAELIIITLLMRLYDLSYAHLYAINPTIADEVFAAHDKGELGNPQMYLPEVSKPSDT